MQKLFLDGLWYNSYALWYVKICPNVCFPGKYLSVKNITYVKYLYQITVRQPYFLKHIINVFLKNALSSLFYIANQHYFGMILVCYFLILKCFCKTWLYFQD